MIKICGMKYEKLIFGKNKNAKNFLLFLKMSTSDEIMSISGIVVYDIIDKIKNLICATANVLKLPIINYSL